MKRETGSAVRVGAGLLTQSSYGNDHHHHHYHTGNGIVKEKMHWYFMLQEK